MNKEVIQGEVGKEVVEDSCGCTFCDVGLTPTRLSFGLLHLTARGQFPCTRAKSETEK